MKWLIASDIHGSAKWCKKLVEAFYFEKADKMLLLGDILYHGPRNSLPEEYNPKDVIATLNPLKEKILCVRGNCDAEVDQMVLEFPIMAEYIILDCGKKLIFATHGHIFNESNPIPAVKDSILICGHTHVPACNEHKNFIYINCGSVSIPKENSFHTYMIFEDDEFIWKNLETKSAWKNFKI